MPKYPERPMEPCAHSQDSSPFYTRLLALLSAPEPDDPQDAVVAQQYLGDYQTFFGTARYWTETFAKISMLGAEEKIQKLVEMGFPEGQVRSTLEAMVWDENMALEKLCCG